jgi:hypothetical protein
MCFLQLGKPRPVWENKNKMGLRETGWNEAVWKDLFQEWDM